MIAEIRCGGTENDAHSTAQITLFLALLVEVSINGLARRDSPQMSSDERMVRCVCCLMNVCTKYPHGHGVVSTKISPSSL